MRNGKANLKKRITTEAIKLFLRKGFRNTTINDIIDRVQISKGAFYWHFTSKNELLATIIKEFEETFVNKMIQSVTEAPGSFLHKFKYYHKYITEFAFDNKELCMGFMTLSAELAGNGTDLELQVMAVYEKQRSFLKTLLAIGEKEMALRENLDTGVAAHVIMAINNGMLLEWYMNQTTIDSELFARTYRDITLTGILKGI